MVSKELDSEVIGIRGGVDTLIKLSQQGWEVVERYILG